MKLDTDKMLAQKDGPIGWMTFNNPARRNAMSLEMWQAIGVILEDFENDPNIRVVVMKGAGDKAFVSGADISQFEKVRHNAESTATYSAASDGAREKMANLQKPLIAMIQGFCMGGGLAVAMSADFRIATPDSQFGIPAGRLGIAYGFDGLRNLVSLVGPAMARSIMFTARRFGAEEALRIGLIEHMVPAENLESTVREYAGMIAENAPLSIRASKQTIKQILLDESQRDMKFVAQMGREAADSADFAEGRKAFMEKRKPVFTGR
jgi:enoyl-CoA hydratase/carnithine racemase